MGGSSFNVFIYGQETAARARATGVRFVTRTSAIRVVHGTAFLSNHCHPSREIKLISHMSTRSADSPRPADTHSLALAHSLSSSSSPYFTAVPLMILHDI
jgi:hypothetical protein